MDLCNVCRFWLNWDSEMTNLGECHRFPPRMATARRADADGESAATVRPAGGGWPLTAPDDWCGEYQPLPTRAATGAPASAPRQPDSDPAI